MKRTCKVKKKKSLAHYETKNFFKILWSLFHVIQKFWACSLRWCVFPGRLPWRKLAFLLWEADSWTQLLHWGWELVSTSFSSRTLSGAGKCRPCVWGYSFWEFICVLVLLYLEGHFLLGILQPFWPLHSCCIAFCRVPWALREEIW